MVDKKEIALLLLISGAIASRDYDLSSLIGKKAEIRIILESDTGVRAAGPPITRIEIKLGEHARPIRNHQKLIPGASLRWELLIDSSGRLGVPLRDALWARRYPPIIERLVRVFLLS